MFKDVHSSAPVEQEMPTRFSQGDDFFQRLQTAFTGTVEDHENITKDKTRYLTSYRKVSFLTSLQLQSMVQYCDFLAATLTKHKCWLPRQQIIIQ